MKRRAMWTLKQSPSFKGDDRLAKRTDDLHDRSPFVNDQTRSNLGPRPREIVERGTHASLVQGQGIYQQMYQMQAEQL